MIDAPIEVYTDGSATSNDKPGGWAFRIICGERIVAEKSGHLPLASNNDAELEAALQGLLFLRRMYDKNTRDPAYDEIYLVSDSQLVLGWATGNFRAKQPGKMEKIAQLSQTFNLLGVKSRWVKGHSGNVHNERCDKLAKNARLGITEIDEPVIDNSKIGKKRHGTLSIWFRKKKFIIDLESMLIEEYNKTSHGSRETLLELKDEQS